MTNFQPNPGPQPQPSTGSAPAAQPPGAVVGGLLSAQALNSTKAEVQKLVDSANSKGFAINDEGADAYIKVFSDFEAELTKMQFTVQAAAQAPQLGTSPYAKQVAQHTMAMASGDYQSFDTALKALTIVVQQAKVAFEQAKKNYAEMEDEAVQTFKGLTD